MPQDMKNNLILFVFEVLIERGINNSVKRMGNFDDFLAEKIGKDKSVRPRTLLYVYSVFQPIIHKKTI